LLKHNCWLPAVLLHQASQEMRQQASMQFSQVHALPALLMLRSSTAASNCWAKNIAPTFVQLLLHDGYAA